MNALNTLGQRQQLLLQSLLQNKQGLTVDELSVKLDISRNAVNQHLSSLDGKGFIENTILSSTGGRPSRIYTLSGNGLELFPRHYALFSKLLIGWVKQKLHKDELESCMLDLGLEVAGEFKSRLKGKTTEENKIKEVVNIMQELGYEASTGKNKENVNEIVANNCVFHQLASENDTVCKLDITLISSLLNKKVIQSECMVKEGKQCRFSIPN